MKILLMLLIKRIKSKSPAFYKKMRWLSGLLAITCGFIMAFMKVNYFHIDSSVATNVYGIADHIGAFVSGIWGLTWTGTADPDLLDLGSEDNQNPPKQ